MRQTPNAQKIPVEVVGSNKYGRYQKISTERTVNMFISDDWLLNTAGYKRLMSLLATGEGRGAHVSIRGNLLIVVINASVYALDANLYPTLIGTLATESGEVFIDENLNSQVAIVDGRNLYIYNYSLPPNLTIQTGLGTLIPNYIEYHNTLFLIGNANRTSNGAAWYVYQFATPTTVTQFAQLALQTKPDFAQAVIRLPGGSSNVLVLGSVVGEIWTSVPTLEVYRRNSTINVDYGTISVSTIARSDKFIVWLAVNESNAPVIMVYSGQGAKPISTDGIDYELSQIQFPSQSTATLYRQDGHLFYQLTFYNILDNVTFLYDFTTESFFELTDYAMNYHPARDYVYFNGKTYFISLNNASLYQSSTNFTTYDENLPGPGANPEFDREIQRLRICNTIRTEDSSQFRVNSFVMTIEQGNDTNVTGASLLNNENLLITEDLFIPPDDIIITEGGIPMADENSGAGIGLGDLPPPYQPRVDCSVSRDGGITWSNTVSRGLNPVGYRQNILNWDNMGRANYFTIKLRFWGTARFVVFNGFVELF